MFKEQPLDYSLPTPVRWDVDIGGRERAVFVFVDNRIRLEMLETPFAKEKNLALAGGSSYPPSVPALCRFREVITAKVGEHPPKDSRI